MERETPNVGIVNGGSNQTEFISGRTEPSPQPLDFLQFNSCQKSEDNASGTSTEHYTDNRSRVEGQLRKCKTNTGTTRAPVEELKEGMKPLPVTPRVPEPEASVDKATLSKARGNHLGLITAKEINSCIVASESTRIFCSIIIALSVVLSNISLPHNIIKSKSTIASRPLYILLLTDVTIVLVRLLEKQRHIEKVEEEKKLGPQEDEQNWAGAVKILEMGLAIYQTIRAIFIDFSFYTVVVICGLSLV